MQPDQTYYQGQGYTYTQLAGGPNSGFWYIVSVDFKLDDNSGMNPMVPASAPMRLLSDPTQAQQCRTATGLAAGAPVYVNFYTFNEQCMGLNMAGVASAIWNHEGFGSTGSNGHEASTQASAAQPANDPFLAVEDVVAQEDWRLMAEVTSRINPITERVTADSKAESFAGNWPGGYLWFWDPASGRYVQSYQNAF